MLELPQIQGFYVYILLCKGNTLYTGWTTDIKKRYEAHVLGKGAKYTKAHPPIACVYYECCDDKIQAMKREYEIKQFTRSQKEALWKVKEE